MERPPCQRKLDSRAPTPPGIRTGTPAATFCSFSRVRVGPPKLNGPSIRLTTTANSGRPWPSSSSSTDRVCGAIASSAKLTSPITNSRGDFVTRFRKCASVGLLHCRARDAASQAGLRGFIARNLPAPSTKLRTQRELRFSARRLPGLTADKLHKTHIEDNTLLRCKAVGVKGIGPRMSEVSDAVTVRVSPL